jgi:transposase
MTVWWQTGGPSPQCVNRRGLRKKRLSSCTGRRTVMQFNAYSGLDVHKETIVIAIAEAGRKAEVHFHGEIANARCCCEIAEETRQPLWQAALRLRSRSLRIWSLSPDQCRGPGLRGRLSSSHAKTRRRSRQDRSTRCCDAARLSRAGELTSVWVPDEAHEAMRDLIRAREAATKDGRSVRQRIQSFLLRHGARAPHRDCKCRSRSRARADARGAPVAGGHHRSTCRYGC